MWRLIDGWNHLRGEFSRFCYTLMIKSLRRLTPCANIGWWVVGAPGVRSQGIPDRCIRLSSTLEVGQYAAVVRRIIKAIKICLQVNRRS